MHAYITFYTCESWHLHLRGNGWPWITLCNLDTRKKCKYMEHIVLYGSTIGNSHPPEMEMILCIAGLTQQLRVLVDVA